MPRGAANDNAPDSELYLTRVRVQLRAAIFDFYNRYENQADMTG